MVLYFQGDVCFEQVGELSGARDEIPPGPDGAHVVALGELTGHSHAVSGADVSFVRERRGSVDRLGELYIGHLVVGDGGAVVRHEEHAPIALAKGTYRVRRQREFDERFAAGRDQFGRLVAD